MARKDGVELAILMACSSAMLGTSGKSWWY